MLLCKMRRQVSTVDAGAASAADEDAVLGEKREDVGHNSVSKKDLYISRTITNKTLNQKIWRKEVSQKNQGQLKLPKFSPGSNDGRKRQRQRQCR
jgi:hypothetical protein